jgi:Ca2+-binding RTX toxin-like protein
MRSARLPAIAAACACAGLLLAAPVASAKIVAGFDARLLTISGGNGAERLRVVCDGDGRVKVNGRNPKGGPVACDKVSEVNAQLGGGDDVIDFSGVSGAFGEASFPGFGVGTGALAIGGEGDDRFFGGRSAFNAFYGEGGDDRGTGGPARDVLVGGAGDDRLNGARGRDSLLGNAGADRLIGGVAADVLTGHAGDDLLAGSAGDDVMGGGAGRDRMRGGPGRDRLVGGPGRDDLRGGPGTDAEIEKNAK